MAKEYLVVFEGKLVEGFDKETLLKNLDRAYKKGEDEIEKRLFADGPVEIIRTRKKKEAKFILNGFPFENPGQSLTFFNGGCAYKYRLSYFVTMFDILNNGGNFIVNVIVDLVGLIKTNH